VIHSKKIRNGDPPNSIAPDPWTATSVFVTGATGFIGSHLVAALARRGARITATSRQRVDRNDSRVTWVQVDPADLDHLKRAIDIARPEIVFHLSSLADGRRDLSLVASTVTAELLSTVNVLTAATECGVTRLLLTNSFEAPELGEPPLSPYAAAKGASHLYARLFHTTYATAVVEARIFMVYGPGQPERKLLPFVMKALLAGTSPRIDSPGRALDWIYIDDVVEGLLRLAVAPGLEGQSVDLGTGELTSIRDTVATLCELLRTTTAPEFAIDPIRAQERVARADVAAIRRTLMWQPRISLREGLTHWLADYQRSNRRSL